MLARNNAGGLPWFPLVAGLFFHCGRSARPVSAPHAVAYYLVVFVTFVVAMAINIIGVFAYMSLS